MQKSDWTMILFEFYSSSHNFQSLTGKSTICESSHRLSHITNF
ncbi:hypothetical protein LEP1GSC008_3202 [Leptospira kirschneri serovar Bulgarica str. Nikolaevo]|uniref:Uncharacterized protein n=2 Tax=Leptospira kirschneri TaxID=29507 RepID=A0A0E2BGM2_9LEPT|nr:hypothetical protein LEP1GSC081_3783 [Leptospira kirschneri str. H1]EMK23600.1 hypothetical protein LEP1GSC008_3202 [Leptospira kirschneri serovar Bulgarica str. Nikolaevo]